MVNWQSVLNLSIWGLGRLGNGPTVTDASACKLTGINDAWLSEGFGWQHDCAPSTGSLTTFMIFVDFPDKPSGNDTTLSRYEIFQPDATTWYSNASYGSLSMGSSVDFSGFYRMPDDTSSYGFQRGINSATHLKYIQDALDAWGSVHSQPMPVVDVLYIAPTVNAEAISFSPTYMDSVSTRGGAYVAKKAVTFGMDAYETWKFKVLNHETGHAMCLPDLYPYTSGPTGKFVGGFDLMGFIDGVMPDFFAWHKWKLGWLKDDNIVCITGSSRNYRRMQDLSAPTATGINAMVVKLNNTAVLVAEYRIGSPPGSCGSGLLLYTVTTNTASGEGPIRVLDTHPNSGGCGGDELNDAPLTRGDIYRVPILGMDIRVSWTLTGGGWTSPRVFVYVG
jgi:M6 family metalloprotease-like protein